MTRDELGALLDHEGLPGACDRVRGGEDIYRVLSDLRPFVPRYNTAASRDAVRVFQDIIAGRIEVS